MDFAHTHIFYLTLRHCLPQKNTNRTHSGRVGVDQVRRARERRGGRELWRGEEKNGGKIKWRRRGAETRKLERRGEDENTIEKGKKKRKRSS